jgi:hypothetical protein
MYRFFFIVLLIIVILFFLGRFIRTLKEFFPNLTKQGADSKVKGKPKKSSINYDKSKVVDTDYEEIK